MIADALVLASWITLAVGVSLILVPRRLKKMQPPEPPISQRTMAKYRDDETSSP